MTARRRTFVEKRLAGISATFDDLALDGWRRRHKGKISKSALLSMKGIQADADLRCLICYTPMGCSVPTKAGLIAATLLRFGMKDTAENLEAATSEFASLLARRKRRDAVTCSPSCRTRLYRIRKLPRQAQQKAIERLLTIAERRGLWIPDDEKLTRHKRKRQG